MAKSLDSVPVLLCVVISGLVFPAQAIALEKVTFQLGWDHQFTYAGHYAAKWQGFYEEVGLDVEIRSAITEDQKFLRSLTEVVENRAEFGSAGGQLLLAVDKGQPISLVASIFQQSPVAFFALKGTGLESPADLTRLRVSRRVNDFLDVEMQAMLRLEGIDPELITPYPRETTLSGLVEGRVDVIPGFRIARMWEAKQLGIDVEVLYASTYGVDFYGNSIITHRRLAENRPELVRRFRDASLKGWLYALEHPEEIADRMSAELPRRIKVKDIAGLNRFEASHIGKLILHPIVPLGNINPERWRRMHTQLADAGLVAGDFDAAGFIFDPERTKRAIAEWTRQVAIVTAVLMTTLLIGALVWTRVLRKMVTNATAALSRSESRLKDAQTTGKLGHWELDLRTGQLERSDQDVRNYGREPGDLPPTFEAFLECVHPDDRELVKERAARVRSNPTPDSYEFRALWPDGQVKVISAKYDPVFDDDGKPVSILGVNQDITERAEAEAEIHKLNNALGQRVQERTAELKAAQSKLLRQERLAALGQLTGTVAHELRNPLGTIDASTEVIARQIRDTDVDLTAPLDRIQRNVRRCDTVITELLDFARSRGVATEATHLDSWLASILNETRIPQGTVLRRNLGAGDTVLSFDRDRLRRAMLNLMANASEAITSKYADAGGGEIQVTTRIEDGHAQIEVADNGIGIPDDAMPEIFEPLFSTKTFGVGLGLPTVRQIMEGHGGDVEIVSSAQHQITQAMLWLPLGNPSNISESE